MKKPAYSAVEYSNVSMSPKCTLRSLYPMYHIRPITQSSCSIRIAHFPVENSKFQKGFLSFEPRIVVYVLEQELIKQVLQGLGEVAVIRDWGATVLWTLPKISQSTESARSQ